MDKTTNQAIIEFIDKVSELKSGLTKAYLFGSLVKNTFNEDSDIDIALIIEGLSDNEKFDEQVKLLLLASQIDSRIEPFLMSPKDWNSIDPMINEIRKTGKEIKFKKK